ncbi:type 1 glutamine amidotransferase domain-containing protein [Massilia sp. R2A-15]|uniref:type 1 glutamine amidotransferase domain-containing protein n=1 Tax=Massilia sp. R2A-15 TaxID=3064278 RepID=UPI0027326AEE|nr:type 1 glutamine amidotransferase domain-containing protein [Massilia sp. R2A-15]WLI91647.1 type 1 glutamine amidotransferase domain-containing protein [Massilia sp. R2A-15]
MNAPKKLAGKRIAVLAADGFEKMELVAPTAALREAGAEVVIVSLHAGRIRGMDVHQPADLFPVDKTVHDARAHEYDGLLIPGGYISPDLLRQSAPARDFVRAVNALGRPIASMSQASLVLASAGLATNRTLTSWPGVRDDMVNAGATWLNEEVVRDANWLSSRCPEDIEALIRELIPFFVGEPDNRGVLRQGYSDPQPEEPSEMPGQPLRWLASPSLGAMLGLALVGVSVVAANRRRRGKHDTDAEAELSESKAARLGRATQT